VIAPPKASTERIAREAMERGLPALRNLSMERLLAWRDAVGREIDRRRAEAALASGEGAAKGEG
jgi:hypothetical protein